VADPDPERLAEYRHALALALYRTGQVSRALETINSIDPTGVPSGGEFAPVDLAVTAMSQKQLGHDAAAHLAVEELRRLVQTPRFATDQTARSLLHEAEVAVEHSPKR
jgi:hypothetical protein